MLPPSLPRGAALDALLPVPALKTECGRGTGLAVCPALGLLVTSNKDTNTLSVWKLPSSRAGGGDGGARGGFALVCTLGDAGSPVPLHFTFVVASAASGNLAFTPATSTAPLLLVTDAGHAAVHLVDVVRRTHAGYLAAPETIAGPRGVAASAVAPLVAVSAWWGPYSGKHEVHLFRGSNTGWESVLIIGGGFGGPGRADGQLRSPYGLRFSADGTELLVADAGNGRASLFRVEDGVFVRHVATGLLGPDDVEEVEGGWLVACAASQTVEFVGDGGVGGGAGGRLPCMRAQPGKTSWGSGDGELWEPTALALVPSLGLVVRENRNERLQVFR
jgi:hypothetical protein